MKALDKLLQAAQDGLSYLRVGNHAMRQDKTYIHFTYHDNEICLFDKTDKIFCTDDCGFSWSSSTSRAINEYSRKLPALFGAVKINHLTRRIKADKNRKEC